MIEMELSENTPDDWLRAMLNIAADGMTPGELRGLVKDIPVGTRLYLDRCDRVPVFPADDSQPVMLRDMKVVDAVFREFPSGKILGKFIARLTDEPPFEMPPIG